MKLNFLKNFNSDTSSDPNWNGQEELKEQIIHDVNLFSLPGSLLTDFSQTFLDVSRHGTKFIISNPNEQLLDLVDFSPLGDSSNSVLEIQRSLTGIFNVFKDVPNFSTSFNILNETGKYNIISDFSIPTTLNLQIIIFVVRLMKTECLMVQFVSLNKHIHIRSDRYESQVRLLMGH